MVWYGKTVKLNDWACFLESSRRWHANPQIHNVWKLQGRRVMLLASWRRVFTGHRLVSIREGKGGAAQEHRGHNASHARVERGQVGKACSTPTEISQAGQVNCSGNSEWPSRGSGQRPEMRTKLHMRKSRQHHDSSDVSHSNSNFVKSTWNSAGEKPSPTNGSEHEICNCSWSYLQTIGRRTCLRNVESTCFLREGFCFAAGNTSGANFSHSANLKGPHNPKLWVSESICCNQERLVCATNNLNRAFARWEWGKSSTQTRNIRLSKTRQVPSRKSQPHCAITNWCRNWRSYLQPSIVLPHRHFYIYLNFWRAFGAKIAKGTTESSTGWSRTMIWEDKTGIENPALSAVWNICSKRDPPFANVWARKDSKVRSLSKRTPQITLESTTWQSRKQSS